MVFSLRFSCEKLTLMLFGFKVATSQSRASWESSLKVPLHPDIFPKFRERQVQAKVKPAVPEDILFLDFFKLSFLC